jgi:hypothetical protein
MANMHIRVAGYHADSSGNKIRHSGGGTGQESLLLNVTTIAGADGSRPDPASINSVLSSNNKLRGSQFIVTSYVTLDKDVDNSVNILS